MNKQNFAQIENDYQDKSWPSAEEMHRLLVEARKLQAVSFSRIVSRVMRKLLSLDNAGD